MVATLLTFLLFYRSTKTFQILLTIINQKQREELKKKNRTVIAKYQTISEMFLKEE